MHAVSSEDHHLQKAPLERAVPNGRLPAPHSKDEERVL